MGHKKGLKRRLMRSGKGAISLLLAVLLLPFYSLAAVLVEGGRYQNSVKAMDAAMSSSAISVLSEYESYLYQRFGLLSIRQTDDKDLIANEFSKYLELQNTVDMRGVALDSAQAQGVYPLSDTEVLKQQVQDYSSVLLPSKLVTDGIQSALDSFFKNDEMKSKFTELNAIAGQVSAGAKLVSAEADLFTALENADSQMKAVQEAVSNYDACYASLSENVQSLIDHLGSRPDDNDQEALADWQKKADELRDLVSQCADDYEDALQTAIDKVDALHNSLGSIETNIATVGASAVSFTSKSTNALMQVEAGGNPSTEVKNAIKINGALETGANGVKSTAQQVVDSYTDDSFLQATQSLQAEKEKVADLDAGSITHDSDPLQESEYHAADLERFTDSDALTELFAEMDQGLGEEGGLDVLLSLFDIVTNLFDTQLFFDGRLNSTLDTAFYDQTYGGLPSQRGDAAAPAFLQQDEELSQKYLDMIDCFQACYGPQSSSNTSSAKADQSIDAMQSIVDNKDVFNASSSRSAILKSASKVMDYVATLCSCIAQIGSQIANIGESFLERELLIGYLAYDLPNRTDFSTGKTLTNFMYSKAALAPRTAESNIPIVGGLIGGETNYAFCGAELEYILVGNESEIYNQTIVFMWLWLLRLCLDLAPVLGDSDLQAILQQLNAIPVVGSVLMVVCEIVAIACEPLLDTYILVNGGKVPMYKVKGIFLSPSGIPDLLGKVTKLAMSDEMKNKIKDNVEKFTKSQEDATSQSKGENNSLSLNKNENKTGENTDKDKETGNKKEPSFPELDYRTHLLFLMTVFGNEETYLKRLADLVQCEMTQRNRGSGATIQQGVTGSYYDFDIDKAYTTLRASATGSTVQVLPLPSLSTSSQFRLERVIYRGY